MATNLPSAYLGQVYSHADATLEMYGRQVGGFQNAEFNRASTVELVYGQGQNPIGFGVGTREFTFSVDVLAEELHAMQDATPDGFISEKPTQVVFNLEIPGVKSRTGTFTFIPTTDPGGISDGDIGKYYTIEGIAFGFQTI